MNLRETLKIMQEKNNEKNFNIAVETMKRKADKGLLEGITSADIERELLFLEKEKDLKVSANLNLNQEIFELTEAIDKFGYLDIDSWSEEELQEGILSEFISDVSVLLENYDDEIEEEEKKKKRRRLIGGIAAGAIGTQLGIKSAVRKGANIISNNAKLDALKNPTNMAKGIELYNNTEGDHIVKQAAADAFLNTAANNASTTALASANGFKKFGTGISQFGKDVGSQIGKVGSVVGKTAKSVGSWAVANPGWAGALGGVGALGLGVGAALLIRHLRKKRREKALTENLEYDLPLFESFYEDIFKNIISNLETSEINFLLESSSEGTKEIISMFQNKTEVLDEAVTYIDNAGNLKTKSVIDYNKDMHEYHTETQIAKYEKKKKKRDYKLISEDIDNIKKLSEMSLEDILNEEWDS